MVEKMKFITLSGHISSMNHVVNRYLSRYNIQLELTANSLMQPFSTLNPYAETLRKAEKLAEFLPPAPKLHMPVSSAEAVNIVEDAAKAFEERDEKQVELEKSLEESKNHIKSIENFTALNIDLEEVNNLKFLHHQFGKMENTFYKKYEKFLLENEKFIFIKIKRDENFAYGVFFSPISLKDEVDGIFASLEFTPYPLPHEVNKKTTPAALKHELLLKIDETENEINHLTTVVLEKVTTREKLAIACEKVKKLYSAFDVKKYALLSRGKKVFTFSGWICEADFEKLHEETKIDDLILISKKDFNETVLPPTKLKNLPIIRQFEFFTRLYGLPEYGEIDPTPVLAITYTLLFGLMFGDIGHGLVLSLLGIIIAQKYHPNLGGIMTIVGLSAAFFGLLYGSIFGVEFRPIWGRPHTDIMSTLLYAGFLGAGLILVSIFLNMYNAFKQKKIIDFLFGANGLSGLIFYISIVWVFARIFVQGHGLSIQVFFLVLLPFIFVAFKHPLENIIYKRQIKVSAGQFIFGTAVEMFETLLTYATNTVSFIRVGAFAVSHAGMMHVVLELSRSTAGTHNFLIFIIGNFLVMGVEGLLVGIQVLRLDLY